MFPRTSLIPSGRILYRDLSCFLGQVRLSGKNYLKVKKTHLLNKVQEAEAQLRVKIGSSS